jgi:hypothetical protein
MMRLSAFVVVFFIAAGCATEGDRAQWNEAWKDLRGDNMQMQSDKEVGARSASSRLANY